VSNSGGIVGGDGAAGSITALTNAGSIITNPAQIAHIAPGKHGHGAGKGHGHDGGHSTSGTHGQGAGKGSGHSGGH
jgi:hypothetical protein